MKKIILTGLLSFFLIGCDTKPEKKDISKLTNDEVSDLCKIDTKDLIKDLKENINGSFHGYFKINPVELVNINSFSHKKIDMKWDPEVNIDSKYFMDDLNVSPSVNIISQQGEKNIDTDSLSCKGYFEYSPSFMYGRVIKSSYRYELKRKDGSLDTSNKKLIFNDDFGSYQSYDESKPTEKQISWLGSYIESLNKESSEIKEIPTSKFLPVSEGDLVYLYFANSGRKFTDDEIMSIFSKKWNSTNDTFVKDDIKKEDINSIKEKIKSYKGIENISVSTNDNDNISRPNGINGQPQINSTFNADDYLVVNRPYNKDIHGFISPSAGCDRSKGFSFSSQGIVLDPNKDLRKCILEIDDNKARDVSAKFSSLSTNSALLGSSATHYFHIYNYDNERNAIEAVIVKTKFSIYLKKSNFDSTSDVIFSGEIK